MNAQELLQRFAVLRHEGVAEPHFDLLIDLDGRSPLATWRSPAWPITAVTPLLLQATHRRIYMDYQGPIGGGRGTVTRVDSGPCRVEVLSPGHWLIALATGVRLDLVQLDADQWEARLLPPRDGPAASATPAA